MLEEKLLIMKHQEGFINFIESLKKVDPDVLQHPIDEGKWSVLEIVTHFIPWDEFVLEKRLPNFYANTPFEQAPEEEKMNGRVREYIQSFASLDILNRAIELRKEIYEQLDNIDEDEWLKTVTFGDKTTSIFQYFDQQKDHDIAHIDQINVALNVLKEL